MCVCVLFIVCARFGCDSLCGVVQPVLLSLCCFVCVCVSVAVRVFFVCDVGVLLYGWFVCMLFVLRLRVCLCLLFVCGLWCDAVWFYVSNCVCVCCYLNYVCVSFVVSCALVCCFLVLRVG